MKNLKLKILVPLLFCSIQFIWATGTKKINFKNEKLFSSQHSMDAFENDPPIVRPPMLLTFVVQSIPCNGNNIDLTIEGGVPPYQFAWSNGEETEDLTQVNPGIYQVTVLDDSGIQQTGEVTVAGDSVFSISVLVNDVSCPRVRDGSAKVIIHGGKAPYSYLWSNGSTSPEIVNQNGGNFTVTVNDANNCSKTLNVSIAAPPRFGFNIQQVNNTCAEGNKGSINVIVSGGSEPYHYLWSTGDTLPSIHNLASGTYLLNITDRRNCHVTTDATIVAPEQLSVQAITSVDCEGGNIDLEVSGGTTPYNYSWSNGTTTSNQKGLKAGSYTVEVSDTNNCFVNPLTVNVSNFASTIYEVDKKDVTCFGLADGALSVYIVSGVGPFSYEWSNGSLSPTISGLDPGTYSLKITDGNGCNKATSRVIQQPALLNAEVSVSQNNADLSVTGGVPPYSYLWSNGATTEDLVNQSNGTYTVEISDQNFCYTSGTAIINMTLNASIDCCTDTYINNGSSVTIPVNFNLAGPYVLKYKEIYDHKTFAVKTVTTSENPYIIIAKPSSTITYELVSVSKDNVLGTVCGRATIGVNNFSGRCTSSCFSAELQSIVDEGFCKTFTLKVLNDGHCRFGLSHLDVSVPCGNIVSVSNSRNFPISYGMDPTTKVVGFKVDSVTDFGEKKDGSVEGFMVTYTVCSDNGNCPVPSCAPLMSFKAGQCIFYTKAVVVGGNEGKMAYLDDNDLEDKSVNFESQIIIYPNPLEVHGDFNLVLPNTNTESSAIITMVDSFGKEIYNSEFVLDHNHQEIVIRNNNFSSGLYLITVKIGPHLYKDKIIVE